MAKKTTKKATKTTTTKKSAKPRVTKEMRQAAKFVSDTMNKVQAEVNKLPINARATFWTGIIEIEGAEKRLGLLLAGEMQKVFGGKVQVVGVQREKTAQPSKAPTTTSLN